jgi:hypothetical protein
MTEPKTGNRSMRILYAVLLFVVPYVVISLPGVPRWLGRTVAASIFIFFMTVATFWFGLSPKSKMIRPGGKLSQPQFDSVRPLIERRIRILVVVFGVFAFFTITLPFTEDLIQLAAGQKPLRITGTTTDKSIPLFGVWFLEQSVRLTRGGKNYSLFYSWEPLRVGKTYEFVVLPRTRLILDFRESGG